MAIPGFQAFMLPLLRRLADGKPHALRDLLGDLSDDLGVPEHERLELIPSGRATTVRSRAGWAQTYMKQAGLLTRPRRGVLLISNEGRRVLAANPPRIDIPFLDQYGSFVEFRTRKPAGPQPDRRPPEPTGETPEEQMERLWQECRHLVARELLERVAAMDPGAFEGLVVRVLVAMGYGGSYADAAKVVGKSGDGGIDGIIKEDRLGLDAVYVQAKRWQGVVGRPQLQQFAGSLEGARVSKGVFITNSSFTAEARTYVEAIGKHIVLVDGQMLADLMIEYGVAVVTERAYPIPKVDEAYFEAQA